MFVCLLVFCFRVLFGRVLWLCFVDDVEWCFGCLVELGEIGVVHNVVDCCFVCLGI